MVDDHGNMPILEHVSELSQDQKYLYDLCRAVIGGNLSKELECKKPGPMSHSRWLTTASRILRTYVCTPDPSWQLEILCKYIVRVYAPVWFNIKASPYFWNGAAHFWKLVFFSRFLPTDCLEVVDNVLRRNAFYAHPKNLLISMLCNVDETVRKFGYQELLKCQKPSPFSAAVHIRKFKVPSINLDAQNIHELIDWQDVHFNTPPVLLNMEFSDILDHINCGSH